MTMSKSVYRKLRFNPPTLKIVNNPIDKLRDEFEDHLNSDSSFNYDEDEFEEWLKDLC